MMRVALLVLLVLIAPFAMCETIVIEHATLYPATSAIIQDGSIVIVDGKITDIGAGIATPSGAKVIDGGGKHVLPGFIDTHSHMGVYAWPGVDANSDGNELTDPISLKLMRLIRFIRKIQPLSALQLAALPLFKSFQEAEI